MKRSRRCRRLRRLWGLFRSGGVVAGGRRLPLEVVRRPEGRGIDPRWRADGLANGRPSDLRHRRMGGQRVSHGLLQCRERGTVPAKADLGLGGMDVDVDRLVGDMEVDDCNGVPSLHQEAVVGLLEGVGQHPILDPPSVDEDGDVAAVRAGEGRRADHPCGAGLCWIGLAARDQLQHLLGIARAVDVGDYLAEVAGAGAHKGLGLVVRQAEAHGRVGEGVTGHHRLDARGLAGGRAKKLSPSRKVAEQVPRRYRRPRRCTRGLGALDAPVPDGHAGPGGLVGGPGDELHVGDCRDAGQGLAAEAEGRDGL